MTTPGGRIDVDADVRVAKNLPSPMIFCFAEIGRLVPTGGLIDPITARCEDTDPFGDGTVGEGDAGPLVTISYDALGAPFDATADIVIEGDLPIELPDAIPLEFGQFKRVAAQVALTHIPSDFTAFIGPPAETMHADAADEYGGHRHPGAHHRPGRQQHQHRAGRPDHHRGRRLRRSEHSAAPSAPTSRSTRCPTTPRCCSRP